MVAQIAFSVLLLAAAGLAWRSLSLIDATDLGFSRDHLLLAGVISADGGNFERVRQNLRELPGVEAASWAIAAPPHSHPWMGLPAQAVGGGDSVPTDGTFAGPEYLRALGVPLLTGREAQRPGEAVINLKMAAALWPRQSALGRTFLLGTNTAPLQVVGVIPNGAYNGVGEDGSFSGLAKSERRPFVYLPDHLATAAQDRTFHIRYRGALAGLPAAVRAAIHRSDPRLTVFAVRTMETEWRDFTGPIRIVVTLVACFGAAALFVSALGLYAVVAFYTGKRTREMGIRAAMGASPAQTLGLIVKEGMLLTAIGLAVGLAVRGIAGRVFGHLLFGVAPTDALTWVLVATLVAAVSLAACYLPARRASRVDPMLALRQD
jgi:hypothetical protein